VTSRDSTEVLYDDHSQRWARSEPTLLSDYTARPRVVAALGDLTGRRVLDLGCGEGYVARTLLSSGAAFVHGFDISAEMVQLARSARTADTHDRLEFEVRDLAGGLDLPPAGFDDAIAVFLFNYLTLSETASVLATVIRLVRPGGRFVFTVPHPALAWMRPHEAPFYFDGGGSTYRSAIDRTLEGRIWRRDGVAVPVRAVHKTFTDYNRLLREAGIRELPEVEELYVTEDHMALDPDFFGPLQGMPLHVLFRITLPE
jgi:SAM-dependent methyltransferase